MIRRDALSEYVRGSLWVLPALSVLAALAAGSLLSLVRVGPHSPLAFEGTAGDARALLIGIAGTMVTVIALLLGLTVVALQLSSTQYSPRLLRSFLRDRPNQVVLSAFVAMFAYSAAGLYTVGVSGGRDTASFPRLAVSGALVLLFVSLGLLVYFADHLVHSIQVDAIMNVAERRTLAVIRGGLFAGGQDAREPPAWAVPVASRRSGYVQTVRPGRLLARAAGHGSACGCGLGWASTWSRARRWRGSGAARRTIPPRTRGPSCRPWMPGCGSGSSAPWSKTPRSASGSWSTWRARRCPRRSTILIPRSRPSITCR